MRKAPAKSEPEEVPELKSGFGYFIFLGMLAAFWICSASDGPAHPAWTSSPQTLYSRPPSPFATSTRRVSDEIDWQKASRSRSKLPPDLLEEAVDALLGSR